MKDFLLAVAQYECAEDVGTNRDTVQEVAREAAELKARVLLLPELAVLPYFCQQENPAYFDLAETIPGPTTEWLSELARRSSLVIVTTLFERRPGGLFHNTAVVIENNGEIAGIYRKMHIPQDPGYREKFYFAPGDSGFVPIDSSVGKLGVLVCWDQWFPEAARLMALAGANLLLYPSAIGWVPTDEEEEKQRQQDAWRTIQRGHAIANGLPLSASNRVGQRRDGDADTVFWGHSFIAGPQGEVLAQAGTERQIITATIQPGRTEELRREWPFARDRRVDAYNKLIQLTDDTSD